VDGGFNDVRRRSRDFDHIRHQISSIPLRVPAPGDASAHTSAASPSGVHPGVVADEQAGGDGVAGARPRRGVR
jgi:hypothetical protein